MKHQILLAAIGLSLAALPAHASTLLCRPQIASAQPLELRLEASGTTISGKVSLENQSRDIAFTESVASPITRYQAEGYSIAFSKLSFVPSRNPFPADAGRAISAKAEKLTLPDGSLLENLDLACVRLEQAAIPPAPPEDSVPTATYGEMIQMMNAESAGTIGEESQSI
ncbi:MAG: hypothetical protein EOP11_11960 [Proteobacteria bacterium]|nr:MAG: hypothetical protein EOP11_11960 [Pseudomonadota bacterium]